MSAAAAPARSLVRRHRLAVPVVVGLLVLVVAGAVVLVVARHASGSSDDGARQLKLSAVQRRALLAAAPVVRALPRAIAEVPAAASDLSGGTVSTAAARARLAKLPALLALEQELSGHGSAGTLVSDYDAALAGHPVPDPAAVPELVARVDGVEAQLLSATRVLAGHTGVRIPAGEALARIERDRSLTALPGVLAGWPHAYGALTELEAATA